MVNATVISYIILFSIIFISYFIVSKQNQQAAIDEANKMLIEEDISLENNPPNVQDPYKPIPPETVTGDNTTTTSDGTVNSVPVKTQPPKTKIKRYNNPKTKTKSDVNYDVPKPDSVDYTKTLDSLQKITSKKIDTSKKIISGNPNGDNNGTPDSLIYKIPDSLKASIDTTAIAIRIRSFPKEWKFHKLDDKSFYLYFGNDTVSSSSDSLTIYMYLNSTAPEDDIKNFTKDFKLTDSLNTNLTAKCQEPKPDPGTDKIIYKYIIMGKVDRLNIKASVNKLYLDNNKTLPNTIDAIIRSISFRNPN